MPVTEQTEFKTSDGRKFSDKREAEKHDALILARQEYKDALRKMNRLIAETTRTADEHLFELVGFHTFYFVAHGWNSKPVLTEVPYIGYNWNLQERHDAVVIVVDRDGSSQTRQRYEYPIGDLYYEKSKALRALVQAQADWLTERRQEIEETAQQVLAGLDPTRL